MFDPHREESRAEVLIFDHAASFLSAANTLNPTVALENTGEVGQTLIPYIVMLAFAVELHLKPFATVCGVSSVDIKYKYGHNYSGLYIQAMKLGKEKSLSGLDVLDSLHIEVLLENIRKQFLRVRYAYEMEADDIPLAAQPSRIVLTAIRSALRSLRPTWTELKEHSSSI